MKSGKDFDPIETREWIESLDDVIDDQGTDRASFLLNELAKHLMDKGAVPSYNLTTPFKNTISPENEAGLLYTSPSPRDQLGSRMPSSA